MKIKKYSAIILAGIMALSLTACDNSGSSSGSSDSSETNSSVSNTSSDASSSDVNSSNTESTPAQSLDPVAVLKTAWDAHKDEQKFPAMGGDTDEKNMRDGEPGVYGVADASLLDTTFGFPAAMADKIDSAGSLMHMMNANTFTAGAFHVKDAKDIQGIADAIKKNISERQWMCGFPEKLVIVSTGDVIVSMFGYGEAIDTFKTCLTASYADASVLCDMPIEV